MSFPVWRKAGRMTRDELAAAFEGIADLAERQGDLALAAKASLLAARHRLIAERDALAERQAEAASLH